MTAERAGQPLSLLVLDDIFGSLDEARRLHVVGLLRRLADRFPQVILITHIEQVREGLDRVIRVDFDPARGTSVVRDDTPTLGATDTPPPQPTPHPTNQQPHHTTNQTQHPQNHPPPTKHTTPTTPNQKHNNPT